MDMDTIVSLHLMLTNGSQSCLSYSGHHSQDYALELGGVIKQNLDS